MIEFALYLISSFVHERHRTKNLIKSDDMLKSLLKSWKAAEYVAGVKVCLLTFQQVEQSVYMAVVVTDDTAYGCRLLSAAMRSRHNQRCLDHT
jgi:hypothetical protein